MENDCQPKLFIALLAAIAFPELTESQFIKENRMWINPKYRLLNVFLISVLSTLAGCATSPQSTLSDSVIAAEAGGEQDSAQAKKLNDGEPKKDSTSINKDKEKIKILKGSGVFLKPSLSAKNNLPEDSEGPNDIVLSFEAADIREVIKVVLGGLLKEPYTVDPKVQGTVTLYSSKPISKSALLPTLEAVLRMNGVILIRESNGIYKAIPVTGNAARGSIVPQLSGASKSWLPGYGIQIVPLQYIGAREMSKILEPLAPEGGVARVDEVRNLLMLAGSGAELHNMLETIEMFDVDWLSGMSVGVFPLKHVDAKVAYSEIDKLIGENSGTPLAGVLRIVPLERMNALIIVTPQPKYLDMARAWMERLDQEGPGGEASLFVYSVQNGKAENIALLLNDIFGGRGSQQSTAPSPQLAPGLSSTEIKTSDSAASTPSGATATDKTLPESTSPVTTSVKRATTQGSSGVVAAQPGTVRVIADKDNNALLILAPGREYEKIESAIKKLDVVPRQVLIEMTIAEITLTDEFQYGMEWYFKSRRGQSGQLDMGNAGLAALVPGFSYIWKDSAGAVNAVLNALATNSKMNILSSPHIMVADNQIAKIQVGDKVPTTSQSQSIAGSTVGIINTVQYLDTGVLLSVRPHINSSGLVTMEVSQEVSNASKTTTSNIDSPTISKRSAQSTVTIQSGDTMILGGLIKDEKSDSNTGIPFLSQVPILGAVFGNQNKTNNRTELVIMITPKVVNNSLQAREITEEIRKKMTTLNQQTSSKHIKISD